MAIKTLAELNRAGKRFWRQGTTDAYSVVWKNAEGWTILEGSGKDEGKWIVKTPEGRQVATFPSLSEAKAWLS